MTFETLKNHCLARAGVREDFPFGPDTLVFKVAGKMFMLVGLDDDPLRINVKCEPEHAEALRAIYPSVYAGYHMNKRHWNTVILDGSIPDEVVLEMVDDSYELVVKSLTKRERSGLKQRPQSVCNLN